VAPKSGAAPDTFRDGLGNLLQDISAMMAVPDADMAWLMKLQAVTLLKLRHDGQQAQVPGAGAAGGVPAPQPPTGGPPGMGMAGPGAGGGAANPQMPSLGAPVSPVGQGSMGGVTKPFTPDPEEMRRVLAEQAGS
jgi:hypothetical protein